jgi:mono/diheme cytochrome c family protein
MKPFLISLTAGLLMTAGCSRHSQSTRGPKATAYGVAIVESSGGKQIAPAGTPLSQPVVVQVNDAQGNGVTAAAVEFAGPRGVIFDPPSGITDSSGQLSTSVTLGNGAGQYELRASTYDKSHKPVTVTVTEIALDYEGVLGEKLSEQYCERCHNSESTPARVSNYDNLDVKPHAFADGNFLNTISNDNMTAIITHGGPAINKSALMPSYGFTLGKSDVRALVAYIRAVADPPYRGYPVTYRAK